MSMKPPRKVYQSEAPIFLVGFMGSGKTTVGQALASYLGFVFLDLDRLIESRARKSIAEIFSELGEREFRRLERESILELRDLRRAVVALGGGAYESQENRDAVAAIGRTVWLDCPLVVCLSRTSGDRSRPLLGDEAQMSALLERRRSAYQRADYVIQAGALSPAQLAVEIVEMCGAD